MPTLRRVDRILKRTGVQTVDIPAPQVCEDKESEDVLYSKRATLSHFRDKVWEERSLGDAKLVLNKKTSLVRCLLRQEKTFKTIGNVVVGEGDSTNCERKPKPDSVSSWALLAVDWSGRNEGVVLRFTKFGRKVQRCA